MSPIVLSKEKKKTITPKQNKSSMSSIVLSKEKRRQYHQNKTKVLCHTLYI